MEEQKPVSQENLGRPPDGENPLGGEAPESDTEHVAGRDKEARANRETPKTPRRWFGMSFDRFLLVFFNGLLALFTGTYACFSYQQRKALSNTLGETRKVAESARVSAGAAKDTADYLKTEERAWVSVKTFVLVKEPSVGEAVDIHISLINSGKTPALDIVPHGEIVLSKDGAPQFKYLQSRVVASRTVLPPRSH